MSYQPAIDRLKKEGYVVNKTMVMKIDSINCEGLWLNFASSILSGVEVDKVREIVGDDYACNYLNSLQEIHIKLKP